jgi:hypothetical protein
MCYLGHAVSVFSGAAPDERTNTASSAGVPGFVPEAAVGVPLDGLGRSGPVQAG